MDCVMFWLPDPEPRLVICMLKIPSPSGLTRVGKYPISYELRSIDPLSLRERARVRVNDNSVIPAKGDLCITTVIPAKAGIQGRGRDASSLGSPSLRTHSDHHIRVSQRSPKAGIHTYELIDQSMTIPLGRPYKSIHPTMLH